MCCFDKTGTLTSDHLLLEEVVGPGKGGDADIVMAGCQSLIIIEGGDIVGDPLEKAALEVCRAHTRARVCWGGRRIGRGCVRVVLVLASVLVWDVTYGGGRGVQTSTCSHMGRAPAFHPMLPHIMVMPRTGNRGRKDPIWQKGAPMAKKNPYGRIFRKALAGLKARHARGTLFPVLLRLCSG